MAKFDPKIDMEFHANSWPTKEGVRDMRSWVRGQWIPFDGDAINQFMGHHACSIGEEDISYIQLKHGRKTIYTHH